MNGGSGRAKTPQIGAGILKPIGGDMNNMRKPAVIAAAVLLAIGIAACGTANETEVVPSPTNEVTPTPAEEITGPAEKEREINEMVMEIGDTRVHVVWENNSTVEALKALVARKPLTIQMSKYGGFEQVGSIGQSLPRDDKQTTTSPGDIVLYSGDQLVVFYGSNSWSYTRLGFIVDRSEKELSELLGKGDVTITIKGE